ncbi:hypothetical protein SAMN05428985_104390 [Nocardioides sp. YR527]|uniref:hypothetical protein n=1 Tax=Nocardioides sp. YR527 TaxID=1881028 RepID=UPI00088D6163|nr:hypothetical protein [Nocardioides sp. YR527]SDK53193.1 hypothetical protein SAMN05428985_104390 [Nocardioides sp. YR527]
MRRLAIVVVAAAAGTALLLPTAAAAADGREFGQHVVHYTQAVGFDGTHNPGMHQGFHGFTADHVCVMT